MLIYNHFMIVSYFKTTDKIIYFFIGSVQQIVAF